MPASGQVIEADATGEDNLADPRYYGVDFLSGGPGGSSLSWVSFDISADIDGVFDLDGVTNFGGALTPVVDPTSLVGVTAADITWSFSGNQPNVITANFAPGTFTVGDSFRFACETDLFVSDPCPGGNFATGGALFSAKLDHGGLVSAPFSYVNKEVSVATADVSACAMTLSLPSRTVVAGAPLTVRLGLLHNAPWTAATSLSAVITDPAGQVVVDWTSPEKEIAEGAALSFRKNLLVPAGSPPGVYRVGVGIGAMRQGFVLRSMEFLVQPAQPAPTGGLQGAWQK